MKKITLAFLLFFTAMLLAQEGVPDPGFGTNGLVTTTFNGSYLANAVDFDLLTSGKIVTVGGYSVNANDTQFPLLMCYNYDGTLNSAFGQGGGLVLEAGTAAYIIKATPDCGFLVLGTTTQQEGYLQYLKKFTATGNPDATFGTNGNITNPFNFNIVSDMYIKPDGKILGAGFSGNVMQLNTNGTPDIVFGANGVANIGILSNIEALTLDADGRIVIAGYAILDISTQNIVGRFTENGVPDTEFGTNGIVYSEPITDPYTQQFRAVGTTSNNKIVTFTKTATAIKVLQFNEDGTADDSFGTAGTKICTFTDVSDNQGYDLAVQTDDKILISGYALYTNQEDAENSLLIRLTTSGEFDTTFGNGGRVIEPVSDINDKFTVLKIQPNGAIVVKPEYGYEDNVIKLLRYLSGESLGVLDFKSDNNAVYVYPNPLTENSVLQYTLKNNESVTITVTDMNGRIVSTLVQDADQMAGTYSQKLLMGNIAAGTYFATIATAKGKVAVKLVK